MTKAHRGALGKWLARGSTYFDDFIASLAAGTTWSGPGCLERLGRNEVSHTMTNQAIISTLLALAAFASAKSGGGEVTAKPKSRRRTRPS
jgi:hypothetical protein